ncbi:MAG TPA: carboxypeptidase regulatory-like domain-containing protein [Acidobacteriaceae bacterium]
MMTNSEWTVIAPRHRRRIQRALIVLCAVLPLLLTAAVQAQLANTGQVLGNITDSTGSVVPFASVMLTSVERGQTLTKNSNGSGEYLFSSVAVGTYTLTITAPGFATVKATGIIVDSDKNIRFDTVLKPKSDEATVTVEASGNTVDTQSATVGVLIDENLIHNMPIDGNSVISLAALLPGVSGVSAPTTFTGDSSSSDGTSGPAYNVSGARNTQNLFLLDGTMWNNLYTNSGLNFPPPDALQEVSVLLNNFKAQYGRNVGSVFNAITKSGTNQFHGVLYEYLQNTALNAQDYFLKHPSKLIQNQYGITVGGPIVRDKLFLFSSYQGLRIAQTANNNVTSGGFTAADRGYDANGNPTPCSSTGYFAGTGNCINLSDLAGPTYRDTSGNPQTYLHNPISNATTASTSTVAIAGLNAAYVQAGNTLATGQNSPCVQLLQTALSKASPAVTIVGNELPSICINPVVFAAMQKYLPLAIATSINGTPTTKTPTAYSLPQNDQNGLLRLDYNLGYGHTLDARYYQTSANDILAHNAVSATNASVAGYEPDADYGGTYFGDIGDTWVIRPNLLNVFRLAYKRYDYQYSPIDHTTLSDFGAAFPSYNSIAVLPVFPGMGTANQAVSSTVNEDVEAVDTLTWSRGKHNAQFGVDFLRLQYANVSESAPVFSFSGTYSLVSQGDEILGLPSNENFANSLNRSGIQHDFYFYAQDDWRILPRLTLNIGLRYELPFRYYQPKNQNTTFIPGYQSVIFPNAVPDLAFVGDPGVPRSLIKNEYKDFAPRFGFAYDLFGNGRTSVRGGFGIFYDATNALTIGVGEPFHYIANYAYPSGGVSQPLLGLPAIPKNYDGTNPQFNLPFSIFFPDRNYRDGYTEAVNFGFQQSIMRHGSLEVNYVGRFGRHQSLPLDKNPAIYDCTGAYYQINPSLYCPATGANTAASYAARVRYPGFNYGGQGVVEYQSIGSSSYNGVQVLYQERGAKIVSLTATFAYAKSLDEFSTGTSTSSSVPQIDNLSSEHGPSDYDVKLTTAVGWAFLPTKFSHGPRPLRILLSNWTQSGMYTAQSGKPFSVTLTTDAAFTAEVGSRQRAQLLPGYGKGTLSSGRHRADKISEWFNTAAWVVPPNGTAAGVFSNQSRNRLRGPAFIQLNLSAGRTLRLPITHTTRLAFRADAINAFNTPNLANPNSSLPPTSGVDYEGQVLATTGGNTVGTNARRIQLSLKLSY